MAESAESKKDVMSGSSFHDLRLRSAGASRTTMTRVRRWQLLRPSLRPFGTCPVLSELRVMD